jgi:phosphoglycerate dehydrogenase-like enzyme
VAKSYATSLLRRTDLSLCRSLTQVDEEALLSALQRNVIAGAGLDVLCHEPATKEHYQELYDLENVVLTPHALAPLSAGKVETPVLTLDVAEVVVRIKSNMIAA